MNIWIKLCSLLLYVYGIEKVSRNGRTVQEVTKAEDIMQCTRTKCQEQGGHSDLMINVPETNQ
eukprot:4258138-Karenia_brevis.AAC.1